MKLNPYIIFEGNAEEVLTFYKNALGGDITMLSRYTDSPQPCDEDWKQKIMHARLEFDGNILMISDSFKGYKRDGASNNVHLSVEIETVEKVDEIFNKMKEGGTISMELQDTFWGARFGMLTDKFGIEWMFNHTYKKEGE